MMVVGILMLLFIGFNRLWHFTYLRLDAMLCGFFRLTRLPVASTFWRYMDSLGINQANSFLNIMSILRERVWSAYGGLSWESVTAAIEAGFESIIANNGISGNYRG